MRYLHGHYRNVPWDFWQYVEVDTGWETPCWLIVRNVSPNGYAMLRGSTRQRRPAHILMYEAVVAPVAPEMDLHHRCEQRNCCNPDHLEPLSRAEHRRVSSSTTLRVEDVRAIRASLEAVCVLARRYHVHPSTIDAVLSGRSWTDIQAESQDDPLRQQSLRPGPRSATPGVDLRTLTQQASCSYARRPLDERFWEKVDKDSGQGCWLWRGMQERSGYGKACVAKGRVVVAHRVAWFLTNGDIPAGLQVNHRCNTRLCVRPDHLYLGTHQQNAGDRYSRSRGAPDKRR
jgi:hypothetical protein